MTLTPLERDLLEADDLRRKLDAVCARVRWHVRELRRAADSFDASTGPVAGALANALRTIADVFERDLKRWEQP